MGGLSNVMGEPSSVRSNLGNAATNNLVVENPVHHDEEDLGLFSNLYTDPPVSIATSSHDTAEILGEVCDHDDFSEANSSLPDNHHGAFEGSGEHESNLETEENHCNTQDDASLSGPFLSNANVSPNESVNQQGETSDTVIRSYENSSSADDSLVETENVDRPTTSVETQTNSHVNNTAGRPSPRSSLAFVFRRALGRSSR